MIRGRSAFQLARFAALGAFFLQLAVGCLEARSAWVTLEDCHYISNPSNDGDSFHVRVKNREFIFRLYFVDAPETDAFVPERVTEQAKYFKITTSQVMQVGHAAKVFTREKLAAPFKVRTCKEDALGHSKLERFYALVETASGDLGEQLVENGLARIHGANANPPDLSSQSVHQKLQQLEIEAKQEKVGAWGVNYGRTTVRSQRSGGVPYDGFDAFFHPQAKTVPTPPPARPVAPAAASATTASPKKSASASSPSAAGKLDVNTATAEQLQEVPGVGPVMSERIIAARPFKTADDLRKVKGIGDAKYEKIRPFFN